MRLAPAFGIAATASICFIVACVGGPGSVDQGGDNGDQYGSISRESNGSGISSEESASGSSTSSTSSSGIPTGTSTSGGSSGVTYTAQPDLEAKDYGQDCTQDYECIGIQQGAVCTPCMSNGGSACNNAAIKTTDYTRYLTDRSTRLVGCDPATRSGSCAPCNSAGQQAYCDPGPKKCKWGTKPVSSSSSSSSG